MFQSSGISMQNSSHPFRVALGQGTDPLPSSHSLLEWDFLCIHSPNGQNKNDPHIKGLFLSLNLRSLKALDDLIV